MYKRLKLVSAFFLLAFAALTLRLFFWQVLSSKKLSSQARAQYQVGQSLQAQRGNILANDGSWLAARGESWLVWANLPDLKQTPKEVAEKLAPLTVESPKEGEDEKQKLLVEIDRINSLLTKKEVVWIAVKHKVSTNTKKSIESLSISGIGFDQEESRSYPEASTGAHLLGFVGKNEGGEDVGYFGLEGFYNLALTGKSGFLAKEIDAQGKPILIDESKEIAAIGGVDLLTHIDKRIQLSLETKLKNGMEKYGAKSATAIVMNPTTGAILGMSSYPSYDPINYFDFGDSYFKNPAVSNTFEPGSVFKILVMAAGLDSQVVESDTKCDICAGPLRVDKYTISTWNNEYRKDPTMLDVIVNSDNVGMAFVGQKLGADSLFDYLNKFGIGKLTGIDLQGEATPKMRKKGTWNIVDVATTSFGQGIAVTPIQMLAAASAIANGGYMVQPQVVDKLLGVGWQQDIKEIKKERVISEETAKEVTAMMTEAAKNGESKWTYKQGFKVAGKTGTAQIPIAGHYDEDKTIASFIGFAPFDNPKFIMMVTLQEPQSSPWASETAAPLWYSLAEDLFLYFGVRPES